MKMKLLPFPMSAPNRVRAKSNGYTTHNEVAPAAPPEARFETNHLPNWKGKTAEFKNRACNNPPFYFILLQIPEAMVRWHKPEITGGFCIPNGDAWINQQCSMELRFDGNILVEGIQDGVSSCKFPWEKSTTCVAKGAPNSRLGGEAWLVCKTNFRQPEALSQNPSQHKLCHENWVTKELQREAERWNQWIITHQEVQCSLKPVVWSRTKLFFFNYYSW